MGHDHCDHELKYCGTCDLVYCRECKREWGGHRHYWPPYYSGTYYVGTGSLMLAGDTPTTAMVTEHNHT